MRLSFARNASISKPIKLGVDTTEGTDPDEGSPRLLHQVVTCSVRVLSWADRLVDDSRK